MRVSRRRQGGVFCRSYGHFPLLLSVLPAHGGLQFDARLRAAHFPVQRAAGTIQQERNCKPYGSLVATLEHQLYFDGACGLVICCFQRILRPLQMAPAMAVMPMVPDPNTTTFTGTGIAVRLSTARLRCRPPEQVEGGRRYAPDSSLCSE